MELINEPLPLLLPLCRFLIVTIFLVIIHIPILHDETLNRRLRSVLIRKRDPSKALALACVLKRRHMHIEHLSAMRIMRLEILPRNIKRQIADKHPARARLDTTPGLTLRALPAAALRRGRPALKAARILDEDPAAGGREGGLGQRQRRGARRGAVEVHVREAGAPRRLPRPVHAVRGRGRRRHVDARDLRGADGRRVRGEEGPQAGGRRVVGQVADPDGEGAAFGGGGLRGGRGGW